MTWQAKGLVQDYEDWWVTQTEDFPTEAEAEACRDAWEQNGLFDKVVVEEI